MLCATAKAYSFRIWQIQTKNTFQSQHHSWHLCQQAQEKGQERLLISRNTCELEDIGFKMLVWLLSHLELVSGVSNICLISLYQGRWLISFHGACYYFLLVFLNYLAWTTVHLKTITWLGLLSFHFVTSALQGISLRKLIAFLGCCGDTGSKFLC